MILVVGATGILGGIVARRLLARGDSLRVLVRESSDHAALAAAGAEIAYGDLKEPATIASALEGVTRVITTASGTSRGGGDTVEAVDGQGTADLIDAAARAGVERFVFVSALGFREDSAVSVSSAKARNEARLAASGIPYTILRPGLFMDVWVGFVLGSQLSAGPSVTVVGDPDKRYGFVKIENVADLVIAALDDPAAANRAIPLVGDTASFREIVAGIGQATGQTIELKSVPSGTAVEMLPPVVSAIWAELGATETPPVTDDVHRRYGIHPIPVETFLARAFGSGAPPAGH